MPAVILFIAGCVPAHAEQASFQRTFARVQHLKECNAGVYYPAAHVRAELALPLSNDDLAGDDSITNCLRVSFIFPSLSTQGYALYLLHVSPGAGVWLNGSYIGASEDFRSATSDGWNYPLLFSLPATLLREGSNELLIQIGPWNRFNRPLDAITIGPERLLQPRFQHQVWVQATGVEIVSTLVGLIGLFAAVLWWNRRSDVIFGLFALSCALWIIRNSKFFLRHFYIPQLYFEIITDASVYWLAAVLFALSFRISNTRFPRLEVGLVQAASLVTLVMCLLSSQAAWIYSVATGLLIPMSIVYFVFLTWLVSRQNTVLLWLLWLASVVTTAFGTYDFLLQFGFVSRPGAYLMPYSALFYAMTVGWALIDRFVDDGCPETRQGDCTRAGANSPRHARWPRDAVDFLYAPD